MTTEFSKIIAFIKERFGNKDVIPLHEPCFVGKEKEYVSDCIESTFVSSIGKYVDEFERRVTQFTGAGYAVATVNGTAALQIALLMAGVKTGDEVLTQAISFVATCNAINYCGATPVFLDSSQKTLGLNPEALEAFLNENCEIRDDGRTYNRTTGKRIAACLPVHVFGHPTEIKRIKELCDRFRIILIEDAAEALGSHYDRQHVGTYGKLGILSFNGNKTITTGGGGMVLTNDNKLAETIKHITTTAKMPHVWEYYHDRVGFNFRMPNINAALGCAQMEMLPAIIDKKQELAEIYQDFFKFKDVKFVTEPVNSRSNYWLNAIVLENRKQRDLFLECTNKEGVITRPMWTLMHRLPMYAHCQRDELVNARWLFERVVNIPSSVSL